MQDEDVFKVKEALLIFNCIAPKQLVKALWAIVHVEQVVDRLYEDHPTEDQNYIIKDWLGMLDWVENDSINVVLKDVH